MALDYNFYIKLFILPTIHEAFFQYFMRRVNINHQQIWLRKQKAVVLVKNITE